MHDYHVHTKYCRHAIGEVREYIEHAITQGLSEIGFNDHYPMFYFPIPPPSDDLSMTLEELPIYLTDVQKAASDYRDEICVKVGVELDYVPGEEELLRAEVSKNHFDYVCGSIHLVDDWIVDHPRFEERFKTEDVNRLYTAYFERMKGLIRSGVFDIVSHIDVLKRFGHKPSKGYSGLLMECLDLIAENRMVVEINTAGLDHPVRETYPGFEVFRELYARDVQVLLGSDAHSPEQVGRHFKEAIKQLKRAGYSQLVGFDNRKKFFADI